MGRDHGEWDEITEIAKSYMAPAVAALVDVWVRQLEIDILLGRELTRWRLPWYPEPYSAESELHWIAAHKQAESKE